MYGLTPTHWVFKSLLWIWDCTKRTKSTSWWLRHCIIKVVFVWCFLFFVLFFFVYVLLLFLFIIFFKNWCEGVGGLGCCVCVCVCVWVCVKWYYYLIGSGCNLNDNSTSLQSNVTFLVCAKCLCQNTLTVLTNISSQELVWYNVVALINITHPVYKGKSNYLTKIRGWRSLEPFLDVQL